VNGDSTVSASVAFVQAMPCATDRYFLGCQSSKWRRSAHPEAHLPSPRIRDVSGICVRSDYDGICEGRQKDIFPSLRFRNCDDV
jgi:hypothetical protein